MFIVFHRENQKGTYHYLHLNNLLIHIHLLLKTLAYIVLGVSLSISSIVTVIFLLQPNKYLFPG